MRGPSKSWLVIIEVLRALIRASNLKPSKAIDLDRKLDELWSNEDCEAP